MSGKLNAHVESGVLIWLVVLCCGTARRDEFRDLSTHCAMGRASYLSLVFVGYSLDIRFEAEDL